MDPSPSTDKARRRSLLRLALMLGTFGFGGGMSLIAAARHRLVDRDHWLDDDTFLRDLAVAQAVPGTTAANFAALLGLRAAGWRGAVLGVFALVLPSVLLMGFLAAGYDVARKARPVIAIFSGLGPAVVAVTLSVGIQFTRRLRKLWQLGLAIAAGTAVAAGWLTVFEVILATVVCSIAAHRLHRPVLFSVSLPILALVFAQISLSMFGGGLAMVAAVEHQLVIDRHWLTPIELADGIALSQITPGPLATASTFFGYRIAGIAGAVVATLALVLPPLGLILAAAEILRRHGKRPDVALTIEALSAATMGLILASSLSLARSGAISLHWPQLGIDGAFVAAGTAVLLFGVNPLWVLGATVALHAAVAGLTGTA